jgi:hypothetical protein
MKKLNNDNNVLTGSEEKINTKRNRYVEIPNTNKNKSAFNSNKNIINNPKTKKAVVTFITYQLYY